MIDKFPFSKCEHPTQIVNPHTGEKIVVPCGKCRACVLRKNSRLTLQCELESLKHKFCYFITLTYRNSAIPLLNAYLSNDIPDCGNPLLRTYALTRDGDDEIITEFNEYPEKMTELLGKFYLFDKIPYLKKDDLQKFLKRLRKHISKFSKEKIRYFGVGEYGPAHFRPHYHLILWFEAKEIADILYYAVSKSWTHGRIDVQASKGQCADYVASYVNSSCTVPQIFKLKPFRPFCVHSRFLGQSLFESEREEVYALAPENFVNQCSQLRGKNVEYRIWSSYYARFYPKCEEFSSLTESGLYFAYTCFERAKHVYDPQGFCSSVFDLAKTIYKSHEFVYSSVSRVKRFTDGSYGGDTYNYFNRYFPKNFDYIKSIPEEKERICRNIYKALLISRHFLEFCCYGRLDYDYRIRMVRRIVAFYKYLDYARLTQWYEAQQEWFESDLFEEDDIPFLYDNIDHEKDVMQCRTYRNFIAETSRRFVDKIKHKKLNDLNRMFFDEETQAQLNNIPF